MKCLIKSLVVLYIMGGLFIISRMGSPPEVSALSSTNYRFVETSLGGSGLIGSQSANFQAATSSAILGLSSSISTNYQLEGGNLTTSDPALAFAVDSSGVNFGTFSAGTASTATLTFRVIDYTSYGYVVQTLGSPPKNGGHTISAMSSTTTSQAGTEQFGINLVANTSPVSFGANPDHGQFGFGSAATNYNTANNYRFVSGETIASAPKSSGETVYTVSYIVNVSSLTPGGQYVGDQTILCTGTY